jgi:hypothetical protein
MNASNKYSSFNDPEQQSDYSDDDNPFNEILTSRRLQTKKHQTAAAAVVLPSELMIEETQTSLPMTPATNNNGSAEGGSGNAAQNNMMANAFESDSSEETADDKITEMNATLNK